MYPCNRTQFTPQRGASMAAQHATGEQVLPSQHSCAHLGVCQSRKPACEGCTAHCYSFAPGVIDHGRKRSWLETPYALAKLVVTCALAGLLMGYVARSLGWA
jgi:hypothetical protein